MSSLLEEMRTAALSAELMIGGPLARNDVANWRTLVRSGEIGLVSAEVSWRSRRAQIVEFGHRQLHAVLPVQDGGALVDLLVFDFTRRRNWGLVRGDGRWLGDQAIERAKAEAGWRGVGQLVLHRHALDWLQADREGAVVLDVVAAASTLIRMNEILVPDQKFGDQLIQRIRPAPPRLPTIQVQESGQP